VRVKRCGSGIVADDAAGAQVQPYPAASVNFVHGRYEEPSLARPRVRWQGARMRTDRNTPMPRHVLQTTLAALLAGALALRFGLPMPQVAMACVFILMQTKVELVLVKGLYRLAGTLAGALAVTLLGEWRAGSAAGFLLAIGGWVSICTLLASFGSQFRAYAIVLAGYTAAIVGIPVAFEPARAGAEALLRLQEVGLGILCAAIVAVAGSAGERGRRTLPLAAAPATGAAGGAMPARDLPAALAAALRPACALFAVGAFWIGSGWPGGAMATLNTTVNCALLALAPVPVAASMQMARGTLLAVAASLLVHIAYALLGAGPAFCLVLVPALALGAVFTGRLGGMGFGLGYSISLCMLGLPEGLARAGRATYLDDAAGILLSVAALLAISAAVHRLTWRPERRATISCSADRTGT
jgi:uncharacterized membrane protein YccC